MVFKDHFKKWSNPSFFSNYYSSNLDIRNHKGKTILIIEMMIDLDTMS